MAVPAATRIVIGIAGVTLLHHTAKTAVLIAETPGTFLAWIENSIRGKRATGDTSRRVDTYLPVSEKGWQQITFDILTTIVLATLFMYVSNKYCPSVVADANWLLHRAVSLQFTPDYIPFTKLAGL